jgi:hypothetical protein
VNRKREAERSQRKWIGILAFTHKSYADKPLSANKAVAGSGLVRNSSSKHERHRLEFAGKIDSIHSLW